MDKRVVQNIPFSSKHTNVSRDLKFLHLLIFFFFLFVLILEYLPLQNTFEATNTDTNAHTATVSNFELRTPNR